MLKEQNGKNASDSFEDVGHSTDAREQMKAYEIAQLHPVSSIVFYDSILLILLGLGRCQRNSEGLCR